MEIVKSDAHVGAVLISPKTRIAGQEGFAMCSLGLPRIFLSINSYFRLAWLAIAAYEDNRYIPYKKIRGIIMRTQQNILEILI